MKLIRECYSIETLNSEDLIVELTHGVDELKDKDMQVLIRKGKYGNFEEEEIITLFLNKILWGEKHCTNCLKTRGPKEHFCNKTCAQDYAEEREIEVRF